MREQDLIKILQDLNIGVIGVGIAADRIDKLYIGMVKYPDFVKSNLNGVKFDDRSNINIIIK